MHRRIRLAFFDFDGVIWDSEEIIYRGVRGVYEYYGRTDIPTFHEVWTTISAPYVDWWRSRGFNASENEIWDAYDLAADIGEAHAKPEVVPLLKKLRELAIPCYIVSASSEEKIVELVCRDNLAQFFRGIHGDAEHTKDEHMRRVLREHGLMSREALIVGDRPSDIRDGRNAGVVTVAYIGDHPTEELLGRAAPDHVIRSLLEVERIIRGP